MSKAKVALIYAHTGGGHVSLAKATAEILSDSGYTPLLFDPFPETLGLTHKTFANHFGDIYRLGFKAAENPKVMPAITGLNELTLVRKITRFCKDERPDFVIANHPLAAAALSTVCQQLPHPPLQIIHFCDPFTTHKTWFVNRTAAGYLSPTSVMTSLAIANGIPASKIHTIGWLTRKSFVVGPASQTTARKILGLDPAKFTIFIGGAGQGSNHTEAICTLLTQSPLSSQIQIIVNTGLNASLSNHIMHLVQKSARNLLLVPFTPDPSGLLAASDIVVGKAGPNFIFEAIHSLRPLIICGYLPGHEDGNPDFIRSQQLGWVESTPEQVVSRLDSLIRRPQFLKAPTAKLKKFKRLHGQSGPRLISALTQIAKSAA